MRRSVSDEPGVDDGEDGDEDGEPDDEVGVVLLDAVVDDLAQDQRGHRADGGVDDDDGQEDGQDAPGRARRSVSMRRAVPFWTRCCRTARSWRMERMPLQPPPRPPPMAWPRILMPATYCRLSADPVGQAEPPTAWTPPSTWRISPVVIGKRSLKRARQALATAVGVVDVPAERRPVGPGVLEGAEPRDGLGRHGADRPRRDEVHPDAAGPELLGQVAGEGLEGRLGHAHPVVDGPGHRGVEVEADHRRAAVATRRPQQRQEGVDQRLERVGRDVERRRDVVPVGGEHPAAQAVGRREADGVQQAVEAVPALGQRRAGGAQLVGGRHVDLEDVGLGGQLAGRALGQREGAAGAGEHDVGALFLGQAGHREGQRGVGEDARDEEPLAVEESHCASEVMRR